MRMASKKFPPFLLTVIAAGALAPVAAVAAAPLGGFSVRPGQIDPHDPITRAYFKPAVKAGQMFRSTVVVSNQQRGPLDLIVDGVDGLTGATSGAVYANRQDTARKAGMWVRPARHRVTIPGRGQRVIAFAVRVPATAEAGDHLAGIAFENAHPKTSGGQFSVREVVREVIGIQVRVPGRAHRRLALQSSALGADPGTGTGSVLLGIVETGGKLCKPTLDVALRDPQGGLSHVRRRLDTLLPGDRIGYRLAWPTALTAGHYVVDATGTGCGKVAGLHREMTLRAPLAGVSAATNPAATVLHSSTPWWPFGIAAVGLALGVLQGRRGRRDRRALAAAMTRASPPPRLPFEPDEFIG